MPLTARLPRGSTPAAITTTSTPLTDKPTTTSKQEGGDNEGNKQKRTKTTKVDTKSVKESTDSVKESTNTANNNDAVNSDVDVTNTEINKATEAENKVCETTTFSILEFIAYIFYHIYFPFLSFIERTTEEPNQCKNNISSIGHNMEVRCVRTIFSSLEKIAYANNILNTPLFSNK
jgi:hypothetical protein